MIYNPVVPVCCRLTMITLSLLLVLHGVTGFRQDAVFKDKPWDQDYLSWNQGTVSVIRDFIFALE